MEPIQPCCALNPPGLRFCRTCGRLLTTQGTLVNPDNQWSYEVLDVLAQGGMSTTYLVYNLQVKKLAVLKEINSDLMQKAKARELFAREARVLQSLSHPGVPRFYDFFCTEEHHSLVMEMIHGLTLEQARPNSPAQGVAWMIEALEVLGYLHQRGVLHRDIKPANLILRYHPRRVVLLDYGAVKEAGAPPGTRIATPGYAAQEQQMGRPCLQSDFYGIGATLVYLLTRQFPGNFYHPRERRLVGLEATSIPSSLLPIILSATALEPRDRPQNCAEFIQALKPFAQA